MANTKLEKIANIEEEIQALQNRRKVLMQEHKEQERKARTHRICKRGGLLESMLPETIALNDDQIKEFFELVLVTEFTQRQLKKIQSKSATSAKTPVAVTGNVDNGNSNEKKKNDEKP
jgi:hypothetical protein